MLNDIRSTVDQRVFPGVSCCLCGLVHRSGVLVGGRSRCAETWRLTLEILEDELLTGGREIGDTEKISNKNAAALYW